VQGVSDEPDNDEWADDDASASDRIVLRASATRWMWSLIGSMVIITFGAGMGLGARTGVVGRGLGWFLVALFGFCAVVALRGVLDPGSLVISRSEIDMVRRGRLTTFALADCGRFKTWLNPNRGSAMVVFDYAPDGDSELHRANRRLMGGSRALSDSYGLSADALAKMLNDVRRAVPVEADDGNERDGDD
jgi:hypothetical protein